MTTLQPPRGTHDLISPESERFALIQRIGAQVFESAGFRRIITPMFEDTALFHRGIGEGSDVVKKETYTFTDRADNSLTLRAEGTAPVMRAIISEHLWDLGVPVKVFYDAAMFRYERPQRGRMRQHHQLGIEAVGSEEPSLDADVIATGWDLLARLDVGVVHLLLGSMGHKECRDEYVPKFVAYLLPKAADLSEDSQRRLAENPLRIWDSKEPQDIAAREGAPTLVEALCANCADHFAAVRAFLNDWGIPYRVAPNLVRGFDYYTRTTFEFASEGIDAAQNALGGGGRYDGLVESLGGPALPGIGFGMGIERLLLAQEAAGSQPLADGLDILAIAIRPEDAIHAMRLVREARSAGLRADLSHARRGVKAHMKYANKLGARYVALCGEAETTAGTVTLRAMDTGEQSEFTINEAIAQAMKAGD